MRRFLSPSVLSVLLLTAALTWNTVADARPGGSHGGPDCVEQTDDERASISLRKQIVATELVMALELSVEQKGQLADLVSEALATREQRKKQRAQRAVEARPLLEDYLDDLQSDGAASEASSSALRDFVGQRREARPEHKQQRHELRERFRTILSEDQLDTLRTFRPMASGRPAADHSEERAKGDEAQSSRKNRPERARRGDRRARTAGDAGGDHPGRSGRHKLLKVIVSEEMLGVLSR